MQDYLNLHPKQNAKISKLRITYYMFWIIKEVAKADWEIVKLILDETKNTKQKIFKINVNQKYDITKTILANSITLTPGTITIETLENEFIIHSLTSVDKNNETIRNELRQMEQNVARLEK